MITHVTPVYRTITCINSLLETLRDRQSYINIKIPNEAAEFLKDPA